MLEETEISPWSEQKKEADAGGMQPSSASFPLTGGTDPPFGNKQLGNKFCVGSLLLRVTFPSLKINAPGEARAACKDE